MNPLGIVVLLALVLLGAFAQANWSLLVAPATISFLGFSSEGPLGVVVLGAALLPAALLAVYALTLRTAMLVEARRHGRQLQAQRELAEHAEASRLAELRAQLDQDMTELKTSLRESADQAAQRIDWLENSLLGALTETTNVLSAYVGEVDDKLSRKLPELPE
jgi:uncharacterized integral membrane protein